MDNGTLLLQHLRQIRHHKFLKAASAFVCHLIAEACSCGKLPVISLQCLLVEVSAALFSLAGLPCTHVQHSTAVCWTVPQFCCALLYSIILDSHAMLCVAL